MPSVSTNDKRRRRTAGMPYNLRGALLRPGAPTILAVRGQPPRQRRPPAPRPPHIVANNIRPRGVV